MAVLAVESLGDVAVTAAGRRLWRAAITRGGQGSGLGLGASQAAVPL